MTPHHDALKLPLPRPFDGSSGKSVGFKGIHRPGASTLATAVIRRHKLLIGFAFQRRRNGVGGNAGSELSVPLQGQAADLSQGCRWVLVGADGFHKLAIYRIQAGCRSSEIVFRQK